MQPSKEVRPSMRGPTVGSSPWRGRWAAVGHGTTMCEGGDGVAQPARAKKKGKEEGGTGLVGRLGGMGHKATGLKKKIEKPSG
jgi:hypothetical protein